MWNEELAEEVSRIASEAELLLGTVECGVDGVVSRAVFDTEQGPAVLGDSLIVDDVEQAVKVLELPRPQFSKVGILSAKAARAAARAGQALLGVDPCLVAWGPPLEHLTGVGKWPPVYLALNSFGQLQNQDFEHTGLDADEMDALVNQALQMLRQTLP